MSISAGERARLTIERAREHIRQGVDELAVAVHIVKTEKLEDGIDPRALSVARTEAETAELWAEKAIR